MALSEEEKERRKQERIRKKLEKTHKIIGGIDHKLCGECGKWIPATLKYFYKNKSNGIDGLHPYCKKCGIDKSRKNVLNRKEEYSEYLKRWYRENKERKKELNRQWYKDNKEYSREYVGKWQSNNKDKLYEYGKNRKSKIHNISNKEWENCLIYFENSCAYCGMTEEEHLIKFNQVLHKEHVVHDGDNNLSNAVPSCKSCNSEKHIYSLDKWYNNSNEKFEISRLNKITKWMNNDYLLYLES